MFHRQRVFMKSGLMCSVTAQTYSNFICTCSQNIKCKTYLGQFLNSTQYFMMTGRSQIQGYNNIIQSPEVSSSSDVSNSRFLQFESAINLPRSRRSYRTVFVQRDSFRYPLLHDHLNNDMAIPAPVPRNPSQNITSKRMLKLTIITLLC